MAGCARLPLLLALALGVLATGVRASAELLLAQRAAITNWDEFSAGNRIKGWEPTALDVCVWTGITCASDGTLQLNLGCWKNVGLCAVLAQGTLAPELAQIDTLTSVDMRGQELSGTLPTWGVASVPFQTLLLGATNISGTLPEAWGTGIFPNLQELGMSMTQFTGTLPFSWGQPGAFPRLRQLSITGVEDAPADQQLSGSLPATWTAPGAFPSLAGFDLSYTTLTGTLPTTWGSSAMPRIKFLNVGGNQFSGRLPDAWSAPGALPRLQKLLLGHNALTGPLPASWGATPGAFASLVNLTLDDNLLTGSIPSAWAAPSAFPSIARVNVGDNPQLCGAVPAPLLPAVCAGGSDCAVVGGVATLQCGYSPPPPPSLPPGLAPTPAPSPAAPAPALPSPVPAPLPASSPPSVALPPPAAPPPPPPSPAPSPPAPAPPLPSPPLPPPPAPPLPPPPSPEPPQPSPPAPEPPLPLSPPPPRSLLEPALAPVAAPEPSPPPPAPSPPPATPSPPPPSPAPPPPANDTSAEVSGSAAPPPSSSSSAPVAAIAAGVAGGLVLAAAAAFLLVRRRRRGARGAKAAPPGSLPGGGTDSASGDLVDSLMPPSAKQLDLEAPGLLTDSLPAPVSTPSQHTASLPASSGGGGGGGGAAAMVASAPAAVGAAAAVAAGYEERLPGSASASLHSLGTDPVLSLINSHLLPGSGRQPGGSAATALASAGSAGTGASAATPVSAGSGGSGALMQDMAQWEVQWRDLELQRHIGGGSFGRVYLGHWKETEVAVKILIAADSLSPSSLELPASTMVKLQEEAGVMVRMRHPNLVSFMGLCVVPPCILTEYCARGSLYDVLRRARQDAAHAAELTWQLRLGMAADAARGLLYLHTATPQIIHRDVKSPNLLVDDAWRCKVSDFNLSKILEPQQTTSSTGGAANPLWLAPEIFEGNRASDASDVYGFGLVLYELLAWKLPWAGTPPFRVAHLVMNGGRPEVPPAGELPGPDRLPAAALQAYLRLMKECWAQNPYDRPSFKEVVPRLRALLGPAAPSASFHGAPPGTPRGGSSGGATVGSPQGFPLSP